jgi:hypothetical protein
MAPGRGTTESIPDRSRRIWAIGRSIRRRGMLRLPLACSKTSGAGRKTIAWREISEKPSEREKASVGSCKKCWTYTHNACTRSPMPTPVILLPVRFEGTTLSVVAAEVVRKVGGGDWPPEIEFDFSKSYSLDAVVRHAQELTAS